MPIEKTSFAVLDSKARMRDREARREANFAAERAAMDARRLKVHNDTVQDRVFQAVKRLRGANASATMAIIEGCSTRDRDVYLIAEEIGQNRKTVLRNFPKPRKAVRLAFFGSEDNAPSSVAESDESPETVGQKEES